MKNKKLFYSLTLVLITLLGLFFYLKPDGKPGNKKYKFPVAVVAIFQNDAAYLKEWIEFHRLVGVEHFLLINNLSTDNYLEVLRPYLKTGLVELMNWPAQYHTLIQWNREQCQSYMCALKHLRGKAEWVALIDTDEFLFPTKDRNLPEVLSRFKDYVGIGVNWQSFGTSGIYKIKPNQLLIEALTMRAEDGAAINRHIKSIVRPEYVVKCNNPHFVYYKSEYQHVNPDGVPFEGAFAPYITYELLQINHYNLRDEHYYQTQKLPRWERWGKDMSKMPAYADSLNKVPDHAIERFIPALRIKMGLLKDDE